jgi:hypothetical protein
MNGRTVGRVEAELRHSETLAEGLRELALAELELERDGAALAEDDHRLRLDQLELESYSTTTLRRALRRQREIVDARHVAAVVPAPRSFYVDGEL